MLTLFNQEQVWNIELENIKKEALAEGAAIGKKAAIL